ncbi:MAG: hypothetical protein Q4F65_02405 [Propionibacteriaceae bacterium]|nr:hypothetical protein [Propionibacteriaceae bacterium]
MDTHLLQIRGVSPKTRATLQLRADRRGLSLSTYLRNLLDEEAATPDIAEVFARVDAREGSARSSSVGLIRAERDGTKRS